MNIDIYSCMYIYSGVLADPGVGPSHSSAIASGDVDVLLETTRRSHSLSVTHLRNTGLDRGGFNPG